MSNQVKIKTKKSQNTQSSITLSLFLTKKTSFRPLKEVFYIVNLLNFNQTTFHLKSIVISIWKFKMNFPDMKELPSKNYKSSFPIHCIKMPILLKKRKIQSIKSRKFQFKVLKLFKSKDNFAKVFSTKSKTIQLWENRYHLAIFQKQKSKTQKIYKDNLCFQM